MSEHAELSPSSASRWMACPGSVMLEANEPDSDNEYSREGTAAHEFASIWLTTRIPPQLPWKASNGFELDNNPTNSIHDAIRDYVNYVRDIAEGWHLLTEQKLSLEHITGEKGAKGTVDAAIISTDGKKLFVIDLKTGSGVKVYVENNPQLMIYALAALYQFDSLGDFKRVHMVIHQARLGHIDEWECSVEELQKFAAKVKLASIEVKKAKKSNTLNGFLHPSEKACKFCKARAKCPALATLVANETGADFDDLTQTELQVPIGLSEAMSKVDIVETWCRAVRAKVEEELFSGKTVRGYKLVEGKRGNRDWIDDKQAKDVMKAMRLTQDEMYDFSLLSPAKMEKKLKTQPKKWIKLSELVTQKSGKPSVAPISDPRPPLDLNPEKGFDDVSQQPATGE